MQGGREIKVDWSEEEYCNHYMDDKPNMFKDFLEAGYTVGSEIPNSHRVILITD